MAPSAIVTIRTAKLWKGDDGILRGEALPDSDETLDDAKEQFAAQRAQWFRGTPLPFLMDIRGCRSISREARAHFAGPEAAQMFAAVAILIGSPLTRAIGNFFLGLNKPIMTTRLFTSKDEAIEWRRTYL